jgi:hypothetical protein
MMSLTLISFLLLLKKVPNYNQVKKLLIEYGYYLVAP